MKKQFPLAVIAINNKLLSRIYFIITVCCCHINIATAQGCTVDAGNDLTVRSGDPTTLTPTVTGTAPFTFVWSPAGSLSDPSLQFPTATPSTTTDYTLMVTDAAGCIGTDVVQVQVNALPNVTLTLPVNDVCEGQSITTLSGGSPAGGNYSGVAVSGTNFDATVAGVGTYTIRYIFIDGNGCVDFDTDIITVHPLPPVLLSVTVSTTTPTCNGMADGTATAIGTGGTAPYTYLWSNGATSSSISGLSAGTFSVTITDAINCNANVMTTIEESITECVPIPTMGQWGLISLSLLLLIFGVQTIKQHESVLVC